MLSLVYQVGANLLPMGFVTALRIATFSFVIVAPLSSRVRREPVRTIALCAEDGIAFEVPEAILSAPEYTFIANLDDIVVRAHYLPKSDDHAVFTLSRADHVIFQFEVDDLSNPNGWMPISANRKNFALTWSNGGAAGGWSTKIFQTRPDGSIVERKALMAAVESNFTSRHNCVARGDNFEAVRWADNDHLLIAASVYGTGDCGMQAGYTEGYVVRLSSGVIERRMSEHHLLNLPAVCTWNVAPLGTPHHKT